MAEATAGPSTAAPRRRWFGGAPQSEFYKRQERLGWLLVTPTVIAVIVVALYPLLRAFYLSLTDARLGGTRAPNFVGFENYKNLLTDSVFIADVGHTVFFTFWSVTLELILGLGIALVINSNFKGRGLMRTAMLVPWAIPTVISAQMWRWMFNDVFGVVNDVLVRKLGVLGAPVAFLANPQTALPAIVAVDVWKTTPFMALLLLAGLQVIPSDIYEAGSIDGATGWQQFWLLTLPLLQPAILVALIFRTLAALQVFDVIYVMTSGGSGTESMSVYARRVLIDFTQLGYGSAVSVVIFVIIMAFVAVYMRMVRVEEG